MTPLAHSFCPMTNRWRGSFNSALSVFHLAFPSGHCVHRCNKLVAGSFPFHRGSMPQAWPNPSFERTAEKLRFSVPRRLRRRAAAQLKR
jgi:hypothetical protein